MQAIVEKMLTDFERGALSRRQLAATLSGLAGLAAGGAGLAAAVALPATPALAAPSLKAITLNHVTVRVPDLQKTSKFYQEFFGMKLAQVSTPASTMCSQRTHGAPSRRATPSAFSRCSMNRWAPQAWNMTCRTPRAPTAFRR